MGTRPTAIHWLATQICMPWGHAALRHLHPHSCGSAKRPRDRCVTSSPSPPPLTSVRPPVRNRAALACPHRSTPSVHMRARDTAANRAAFSRAVLADRAWAVVWDASLQSVRGERGAKRAATHSKWVTAVKRGVASTSLEVREGVGDRPRAVALTRDAEETGRADGPRLTQWCRPTTQQSHSFEAGRGHLPSDAERGGGEGF